MARKRIAVAGTNFAGYTAALEMRELVGEAWNRFLIHPGPVVVASAPGAACFGAAYEFLFNIRYQFAKHDHMLSPREHEFIIPGPEAHWAKLAFEKYFLWRRRHAHV